MTPQNNYCVIMAGGIGSRFWPLSKNRMPKQFLDVLGTGKSFIRSTFERHLPVIPVENFLVVTSELYKGLVLEHLPELKPEQVLTEPVRRNTAPCIAYAAYRIAACDPQANMIVAPSDHLITGEAQFLEIVREGLEFVAGTEKLLTIGIKPSRPETGYGYIQIDTAPRPETDGTVICKVKTFTEKPNLEMAKVFVESGEFFWNSGIFIWSVPGILKAFGDYLPEMNARFASGAGDYCTASEQPFVNAIYPSCENISIDYGIMEKSPDVYVRCGDFGWSDIGTWGSLYQHAVHTEEVNVFGGGGHVLAYDTRGTVVNIPAGKVAVVEGLEDYLVVEKDNALLICRRESEQSIRNYVEDVRYRFGEEFI